MSTVTAQETLPNLLRTAAALMRDVHKPGHCPNADAWHHAAGLVERVAAAEETGAPLRARERDAALRIAGTFLTTHEQTEVDAS